MTAIMYIYSAAAILVTLLVLISVRNAAPLLQKIGALALAALLFPLTFAALAELLSRSKPVALEWWSNRAESADVLAAHIKEDEGVHLWLMLEGENEPRAFVLPWDLRMAEALQEAMNQAEQDGSNVKMRLPFERSFDQREPRFYALPIPGLPPKDRLHPPEVYEQPGQSA